MADHTGIEWTDATWNPLRGCSRVSEGCRNCYAETVAARFSGEGQPYEGLAKWVDRPGEKREARWTGKISIVEKVMEQPLRWKRPRKIFVNSMSDLFHEGVPYLWIDQIFAVMALAPQHTFQVLTKRPDRMRAYLMSRKGMGNSQIRVAINQIDYRLGNRHGVLEMPLPNVWLGVSVEDQKAANERIPLLLDTPAAVRWISAEPLLGPLNLSGCDGSPEHGIPEAGPDVSLEPYWRHDDPPGSPSRPGIDWVVVGGESGHGARAMHPAWARSIRDQCEAADTPFLFKQWGEWISHEDALDVLGQDNPRVGDGRARLRNPGEGLTVLNDTTMIKVGKKDAGRLLDGVLHDGYPKVTA